MVIHRTFPFRALGLVTLLGLAWGASAAGCGGTTATGSGASASTGNGAAATSMSAGTATGGGASAVCALGGDSCTALPCCSGLCTGGVCVCTDTAGNCQNDGQCCSGVCSNGVCAQCNSGASLCTENANCCSGLCTGGVCSTAAASVFSCDFTVASVHECSEYSDLPAADQSAEVSACTAESGTAGTGCPTADALGSCAFMSSGISYSEFYYTDGGETADDAQMGCTAAGGTWTPG
jgi:hypothetical protein